MNEAVKLLLSLSLSGSIIAVLIFALKPFAKRKLSKSVQYYIWIVVLLRLVLPFSFKASIMNQLFYGNQTPTAMPGVAATQGVIPSTSASNENASSSYSLPNIEENVARGVYNYDSDHSRYFRDLFNQYILYLWLAGLIIALIVNLTGYFRFLKHIKIANKLAPEKERKLLNNLLNGRILNGRNNVRFRRNPLVNTPMLIGMFRPYIIVPDIEYDESQLKYIFLHEIMHLKRFDIVMKWLTMIATSIHWFNPLMYFIKKEINHACELACDEAVIKNLSSAEKQAYGDTLISIVAQHKYPVGVLQATMCEEKKTLKERLVSIMNHNKKSKLVMAFSVALLGVAIVGALYLGAGVGTGKDTPPNLYINAEDNETKAALRGTYNWSYRGRHIDADSDHPINFKYKSDNMISVASNQQLVIGTQKLKSDKKYNFSVEEINVYKDNKPVEFEWAETSLVNGHLYMQAPPDAGEYIYTLVLNFKDKGTVSYGFVVRVDMLIYNLAEISKYKTPYIGDHVKVGNIAGHLPVPDKYFRQQYISMETDNKPYKLTVYYEAATDTKYEGEWPIITPDSNIETNSRKNALVVFCMVDNLDEVAFAYRTSKSDGKLDTSKYNTSFTFPRISFEEKYGDLSVLGEDISLLQEILSEEELESSNRGTHEGTEIKLLNAPVAGQVNILISPTIMGTSPYYYCPNDQQQLSEMINKVEWTEVRNYPHGLHRLGISIVQDDAEWDLLDDGSLYYFEDHGLSAKRFHGKNIPLYKAIIKTLHEDLSFIPFDTTQIADIIAAEIIYTQKYTQNGTKKTITQYITDSKALTVMEERFGLAKPVEGGTACPFNEALLILETRDGIEIPIRLATDSCSIYFANGRYFDYGGNNRDILNLFDNIPWRE